MGFELDLKAVKMETSEGCNLILSQSHFIKTVEDLYEEMTTSTPGVNFGLDLFEAYGERLIRVECKD